MNIKHRPVETAKYSVFIKNNYRLDYNINFIVPALILILKMFPIK